MVRKKIIPMFMFATCLALVTCKLIPKEPDPNNVPSVSGVILTPSNPFLTDQVELNYSYSDADGDGIGDACDEIIIDTVCDGVTHNSTGSSINIIITGRGGNFATISLENSTGTIDEKVVDWDSNNRVSVSFPINSNGTYWWAAKVTGYSDEKIVSGRIKVDASPQACTPTGPEDTDD